CDSKDRERCAFRLVRVGAACDYAQGRSGPVPYLLGVEMPIDVPRTEESLRKAEWRSPCLVVDGTPFRLAVNCRYLITVPKAQVQTWTVVYRLREQLLMDLIHYAGGYVTRPGLVEMGGAPPTLPAADIQQGHADEATAKVPDKSASGISL